MKVRNFLASLLVAFLFIGVLTGCANNTNKQDEKISVTDMLGNTIEITKNPKYR